MSTMYHNVNLTNGGGCYILRADSERFGKNEIIFQSPLESDLERFLKENRLVVDFADCGWDGTYDDLRAVKKKELLGYWRMYFRGGWDGRWFPESDKDMTKFEIKGLDNIINYIANRWKKGCDYFMEDEVKSLYTEWGGDSRYLVCPKGNDNYLVMIDTKYGNGDYPCRIYVYREMESKNE